MSTFPEEDSLKYSSNLWGKVELLHEQFKQDYQTLSAFSDLLTKFQNSCQEFSKSINNILSKNYTIVAYSNSSLFEPFKFFFFLYHTHATEFNEMNENIKTKIVAPVLNTLTNYLHEEKNLYMNFCKIREKFSVLKNISEKNKNDFHHSAKLCESLVYNSIQLKLFSLAMKSDIVKSEEKANESINNCKILEDKYFLSLEETNKVREEEIEKEKNILNYYQQTNGIFCTNIRCMTGFFAAFLKKMYTTILKSVENLSDKYKTISVEEDQKNYILKNKSNEYPMPLINFEPYYPEANLDSKTLTVDKKESENLDINFEVISTFQKFFRNVRKDLDMEEEKKKFKLRLLCSKIFKIGPNICFTLDEKRELIELLKERQGRNFFLITLSKQRTKGRFQRSEKLVKDLSEILEFILNLSEIEKDYDAAKNCMI